MCGNIPSSIKCHSCRLPALESYCFSQGLRTVGSQSPIHIGERSICFVVRLSADPIATVGALANDTKDETNNLGHAAEEPYPHTVPKERLRFVAARLSVALVTRSCKNATVDRANNEHRNPLFLCRLDVADDRRDACFLECKCLYGRQELGNATRLRGSTRFPSEELCVANASRWTLTGLFICTNMSLTRAQLSYVIRVSAAALFLSMCV